MRRRVAYSAFRLVPAISLPGLDGGLGVRAPILGKRTTDVVGFLEPAVFVASHEARVAVGRNAFTFAVGHGFHSSWKNQVHALRGGMNIVRKTPRSGDECEEDT